MRELGRLGESAIEVVSRREPRRRMIELTRRHSTHSAPFCSVESVVDRRSAARVARFRWKHDEQRAKANARLPRHVRSNVVDGAERRHDSIR